MCRGIHRGKADDGLLSRFSATVLVTPILFQRKPETNVLSFCIERSSVMQSWRRETKCSCKKGFFSKPTSIRGFFFKFFCIRRAPSTTSEIRYRAVTGLCSLRRGNAFQSDLSSTFSSFTASHVGSALKESRRGYINALYRIPPEHSIPTHSASGEEIDSELFLFQVQEFLKTLKMTQLIDELHDMKNFPYYECIFPRDMLFQHFDLLLPMPKVGMEHRVGEINETLRYMRGCGATVDFHHVLQDTKGCRANGRDFISTQHGILMGWTPSGERTNKIAMETLTGATAASEAEAASVKVLSVEPVELYPDSPPLSDIAAIAGMRSLLVSDDKHGFRAAEQIIHRMPKVHWQVIKMPVGCSFVSHWAGAKYCYDVLCDKDFPEGMERLGETGLNPFPVEWSEPRKLRITMASICFIANFARGSMNAGGYADNTVHQHSDFNYHSRNASSNPRLFSGGTRRRHGDSGAPIEAQLRSGEIYTPEYQSPPRYAPPMHRPTGSLVSTDPSSS